MGRIDDHATMEAGSVHRFVSLACSGVQLDEFRGDPAVVHAGSLLMKHLVKWIHHNSYF